MTCNSVCSPEQSGTQTFYVQNFTQYKAFLLLLSKMAFFFSTPSLVECIWVNVLDWSASTQKIKIMDRGPWCYEIEDVFRINMNQKDNPLNKDCQVILIWGPSVQFKKGTMSPFNELGCSLSLGSSATILRETSGIPLQLELCLLFPGLFLLGGEQPLLFWRSKWQSIALKKKKHNLYIQQSLQRYLKTRT